MVSRRRRELGAFRTCYTYSGPGRESSETTALGAKTVSPDRTLVFILYDIVNTWNNLNNVNTSIYNGDLLR